MTESAMSSAPHSRRGFTVVELLVIVSLIMLLIALLLPALGQSREWARDSLCKSNLRQFGTGFIAFANDHDGHLPGAWKNSVFTGPQPWQWSWLAENGPGNIWDFAPDTGTVFSYVNRDRRLYRCPSMPEAPLYSGLGSNGHFDYSMLMGLAGAHVFEVPGKATNLGQTYYAPIMVEEDPATHLNQCCLDGGHSNTDRMGAWHRDGGNMVAIDTSVHRIAVGPIGPVGLDWKADSPSAGPTTLSWGGNGWGKW